jgi:hypothetical protein
VKVGKPDKHGKPCDPCKLGMPGTHGKPSKANNPSNSKLVSSRKPSKFGMSCHPGKPSQPNKHSKSSNIRKKHIICLLGNIISMNWQ